MRRFPLVAPGCGRRRGGRGCTHPRRIVGRGRSIGVRGAATPSRSQYIRQLIYVGIDGARKIKGDHTRSRPPTSLPVNTTRGYSPICTGQPLEHVLLSARRFRPWVQRALPREAADAVKRVAPGLFEDAEGRRRAYRRGSIFEVLESVPRRFAPPERDGEFRHGGEDGSPRSRVGDRARS